MQGVAEGGYHGVGGWRLEQCNHERGRDLDRPVKRDERLPLKWHVPAVRAGVLPVQVRHPRYHSTSKYRPGMGEDEGEVPSQKS